VSCAVALAIGSTQRAIEWAAGNSPATLDQQHFSSVDDAERNALPDGTTDMSAE
jgi:hypothetical protein